MRLQRHKCSYSRNFAGDACTVPMINGMIEKVAMSMLLLSEEYTQCKAIVP